MDILRPFYGKNRDEYILMEYEGFLINMTECMIRKMQSKNREYWISLFPDVESYFSLTSEQLYEATYFFSPDTFIRILGKFRENLPYDDYLKEINSYEIPIIDEIRCRTMYEYSIGRLIRESFVKQVILLARTALPSKRESEFLINSVIGKENFSKFHLLYAKTNNDVLDIFHDIKKEESPTTIFLNEIELMLLIYESYPKDDRMFIIRKNFNNAFIDPITNLPIAKQPSEYFLEKYQLKVGFTDSKILHILNNLSELQPQG